MGSDGLGGRQAGLLGGLGQDLEEPEETPTWPEPPVGEKGRLWSRGRVAGSDVGPDGGEAGIIALGW